MPFKKKVAKEEVKVKIEEDRVPYVKEEKVVKEKVKSITETPHIPTVKVLNIEPELTDLEKAMKHFDLTKENIFVTKDYPDRIVFITQDGKKLTWPKSIS